MYLHYAAYTAKRRAEPGPLARQRLDFRFGGHELDRNNGPRMVAGFLRELLRRYDVPLPPSVTD
ncbi:hypothetical protein ADL34_30780 [Streptomyces sp. NRRL WC-3605]|nr:hypothetical protein ADL33_31495 [Streptomyces sp. NRRL WC-3604]KUL69340.1 hypothetical protein ADL34_30780 [Streptomyces sp. NRRL WC-3605]